MFKKIALFAMVAMLFFAVQAGRANATVAANLVANGNFATGDFTGWTLGGDTADALYWVNTPDSISNVNYAQFFTYGAPVTISQALATTANQTYTVNFSLYNSVSSPSSVSTYNEFQALWDGTIIQPVHLVNANAFNWTEYQFTATGTGNDTLAFSFEQDGSNFNFTSVTAEAAPVPAPAALLLFGPGLAGIAVIRRRFKI